MNRLETRAGNADNESSIHGGSRVESNGEELLEGVRLVREAPEEEKRVVLLGSEKQVTEVVGKAEEPGLSERLCSAILQRLPQESF